MGWVILLVFAVLALLLGAAWALRGNVPPIHSIEDVRRCLKPVDLQSFQNLIDPTQDAYLHRHLPGRNFRKVQRARRLAAAEYLWQVAYNAGLLVRAGQFARAAENPQVVMAGRNLASMAVRTRVLALLALARISVGIVFPLGTTRCKPVLDQYDVANAQYMRLGMLSRAVSQPASSI